MIDKVDHLDAPVGPQVDGSLGRLGLDHADAFVFHNLSDVGRVRPAVPPRAAGSTNSPTRCGPGSAGSAASRRTAPTCCGRPSTAGVCDVVMFPVGPFVDPRYVTDVLPLAKSLRRRDGVLQDVRGGQAARRHGRVQPAAQGPAAGQGVQRRRRRRRQRRCRG